MTKIDLITGFLGSGKTTFLKQYVRYLLSLGEKVAILEFDYGAINVDMMLLQEFNDSCDLEMVAGGCDYDCHLRRFKTKLIAMGMKKYDRVIVEPSGIFDPDEFFDTLCEEPLDQWYEIGSVISIVDAGLDHHLSKESQYVLISQLAASGLVILSKTQLHSEQEINDTVSYLMHVCDDFHIHVDPDKIWRKPFDELNSNDYQTVMNVSYETQPHIKMDIIENNSYGSLYFMNIGIDRERLQKAGNALFGDSKFGHVIRVKGFIHEDDKWYDFNMTKEETSVDEIGAGQDVVIVIGENLNEESIKSLLSDSKK